MCRGVSACGGVGRPPSPSSHEGQVLYTRPTECVCEHMTLCARSVREIQEHTLSRPSPKIRSKVQSASSWNQNQEFYRHWGDRIGRRLFGKGFRNKQRRPFTAQSFLSGSEFETAPQDLSITSWLGEITFGLLFFKSY